MITLLVSLALHFTPARADAVDDSHAQARALAKEVLFRHLVAQTTLGAQLSSDAVLLQTRIMETGAKTWDQLEAELKLGVDTSLTPRTTQALLQAEERLLQRAETTGSDLAVGAYQSISLASQQSFVRERYFESLAALRARCDTGVVVNFHAGGPEGLTDENEPGGVRKLLKLPFVLTTAVSLYNPLITAGLFAFGFADFFNYKERAKQRANEIDDFFARGARPEDVARYYKDECAPLTPLLDRVLATRDGDPARLAEIKQVFETEAAPYLAKVTQISRVYVDAIKDLPDKKESDQKRADAEKTYREAVYEIGLVNMARVMVYQQVQDLAKANPESKWTQESYDTVKAYVLSLYRQAQVLRGIRHSKIEAIRSRTDFAKMQTEQRIKALEINHEFEGIMIDLIIAFVKSEDTQPARDRLTALQKQVQDLAGTYPNLALTFGPDIQAAIAAIAVGMS